MSDGSFTYYWCGDCGWDTVRNRDVRGPCPLCEGDTGRGADLRWRPATADDGPVEGLDDRKDTTHDQ